MPEAAVHREVTTSIHGPRNTVATCVKQKLHMQREQRDTNERRRWRVSQPQADVDGE